MPTVSVILNSYNQAPYLAQAVESVLGQTLGDLELIIIDNGSTDGSRELLETYRAEPRVRRFPHEQNRSVSARFNEGVSVAAGEFVSFLYSDDFFLPTKLERQVTMFNRLSADYGVVYGPAMGLNERTGVRWTYQSVGASGDVFEALLLRYSRGQIDMSSPLVRTSCLRAHPFYEDMFAEGEAIFHRLALRTKFYYVDEPLIVLRDHGRNAGKAVRRNAEQAAEGCRRLRTREDLTGRQRRAVNRYEGTLMRSYGWQAVRLEGDLAWGRRSFARAIRASPREALHYKTAAGLVLSVLPVGVRDRLNRLGDRLRPAKGNARWVDEYEGLV